MYNQTYAKNLSALKKCNLIYNITFVFYALPSAMYICDSVGSLLFDTSINNAIVFIDGILLKSLFLLCSFFAAYKKKDILAVIAPTITIFNLIFQNWFNNTMLFPAIICAVLTIIANKKYRELEKCDGFPYFNERFEAQKEVISQNKEVFREEYEQIKKNASDTMDEL